MSFEEPISWLLQSKTPSIRFLTLKHLVRIEESQVQREFDLMRDRGPIPAILAKQASTGAWIGEHSLYTPKYRSTHWSMLLLAELGADSTVEGFRRGAEFMLETALHHPLHWLRDGRSEIACFWGNLLRYTQLAGSNDKAGFDEVIGILVDSAMRLEWRCRYNYHRPCSWGAARALWGIAAIPKELRSAQVQAAVSSGLTFLLEESNLTIHNEAKDQNGKLSDLWRRLSFPLFYQADVLLVLRLLSELGELRHPGAAELLEWLRLRRSAAGKWRGSSPFRQRTWSLGDAEETDRWVSLQAAIVLSQV